MDWLLILVIVFLAIGWFKTARALKAQQWQISKHETHVNLLNKAITAAHAGIFYHNVPKGQTVWDKNSLAMYGLGGEERAILPGTWESIIHPEDRDVAITQMTTLLNGKENLFAHVFRILLPSNKVRWIEASGYVIRDDNNKPLEVSGFHFDITKQTKDVRSLKDAETNAVQAMEAKTQFLANMSHEIRTPMNAIIGMIELLNMEDPTDQQRRYINTLQNSSDVLLRIINDILDVSKIEAGKLTLEQKPFDIRDVISQCLTVYTQASDHKDLLLTGRVDPSIPRMVRGDSTRLQQILMNLVGNAFKFTEKGHILIRLTQENNTLVFSISDTGIGISQDKIKTLFERFNQADDSTTRKFGGTGLGLTIVKEIVELWGGNINVSSQSGKGTTFSFELPIVEKVLPVRKSGKQILLCTRFESIYKLWLEDIGAPDVTWVSDLAGFETAVAESTFDCIIAEQRFPGMKGIDLIKQAKSQNADIITKLVGFEKYVKDDRNIDSVDYFYARPFLVNQLWQDDFNHRTSKPTPLTTHIWPDFSQINILCVDDNVSNLMVLSGLLKRFNIVSQDADNGRKAIERVRNEDFDLVLMDYEMPEMDGPEATKIIQTIKPTLVVGLSAHVGEYFEQKARSAGMSGFLRKPIKIAALNELLSEHFKPINMKD